MSTGYMQLMTSSKDESSPQKGLSKDEKIKGSDPEWTSSLKKLYDSVVDEPLPDSFKNLLSKFDETDRK
ncbi:NepR family anti-sigma factor [Aurantiacibacter poecillastricola]|uniref:NepR family anti-sigma factor n=1 Tax=Aurantiacibacter poecillastricola TaxID=3064385 RepID=UPI00273D1A7D|nr:NepR family anti-sigma factor [Aurantiacibacter sp. 219JJ12-13]MDP5261133.1 NepR family anti-sigma factor [Aurantiacibacter sp. 219JJ12-13]